MAPLNPNNTDRYKVFYTVGGRQHVQQIRTDGVSPFAFGLFVDTYYQAVDPAIYTTVIDQVQFATSGTDVFNPVTSGIEGNSYGSGAASVEGEDAYYYDFVGRSTGGRRVRFAQFGAKALGSDYRYAAGESADLDAALAVIDATANAWLAVDGIPAIWKSYVNAGANAYWQRKIRP